MKRVAIARQTSRLNHHLRFSIVLLLAAALLLFGIASPVYAQVAEPEEALPRLDVPYVPTPKAVVDKMLEVGRVGKKDVLYDLGCGDGRVVITAAKERGARGVGIDLNPVRIKEANANAERAGVTDKVTFKQGDLFEANFKDATVVTLYLLPSINKKLRPQLWEQLKVGTRVVSHAFDMGDEWPPEKTAEADGKTIYYWTITEANKNAAKLAAR